MAVSRLQIVTTMVAVGVTVLVRGVETPPEAIQEGHPGLSTLGKAAAVSAWHVSG
jgi:hypothetical protein